MDTKMRTNSQISTTEPKKQEQKQTRTGTESQKWRSHGRLSARSGMGRVGEKVQGI